MTVSIKKVIFALSVAIGMGASVSAVAMDHTSWCEILEVKCSEGNQYACNVWTYNCQLYGGE